MIGVTSLSAGIIIALSVCYGIEHKVPTSTNVIIGLVVLSTIVITAVALTALIAKKVKVEGVQNPKDWKNEILRQKTSKKEGSYGTFVHAVANTPTKQIYKS